MHDPEIECPQCGTMVYYELDRCPECGLDSYPPDDDTEGDSELPRGGGWGTSLAAIMIGWLVSGTVAFVLFYLSRPIFPETTGWQVQSLLFVTAAAFVGGYVSSTIAGRQPILHGLLVAFLSIINAILPETLWRSITTGTLVSPMTLLAWGLIMIGGVAGAVTSVHLRLRTASLQPAEDREGDLYQDLMIRVRHDREVADRLIALERQRDPTASQADLIRSAIARWERDNR
ncbi:MAG: hypothetical protein JXB30_13090 [Anaerolineae bacterium]|nr:hypothetical protein [Anaerolineae bacterium]